MPTPALPLLIPLSAAGPLADLRVADVDPERPGEELVLASVDGELTHLEVVAVGADGAAAREVVGLPPGPRWWDAGRGLWTVHAGGVTEARTGAVLRELSTGIPRGAEGASARAGMVVDLDHDDVPELLVPTGAERVVLRADGTLWTRVPTPGRVVLSAEGRGGGQAAVTTVSPPAVAVADVDGDGRDEVLTVGEAVSVWGMPATPGAEAHLLARWALPAPLRPAPPGVDAAGWTTDARWTDLTGDGRADLLVHRLRGGDGLADTVSEVLLFPGRGIAGLGPVQRVEERAGAQDAFPVDLDQDGDLDVLVPRIRLDAGNVAQAVLSRTVDVELVVLPVDDGRLGEPRVLVSVALPVDGGETGAAWSLFEDLTGDGLPDLATLVDGRLRVQAGRGDRVDRRAVVDVALEQPVEHLWAADLTGDGAAELIAWKPGRAGLTVVRLR